MENKRTMSIAYTDDMKSFLVNYTNNDWKDHGYTYGVHNFIVRIINLIPELIVNADFTIRMEDIVETIQELIAPDNFSKYNTYTVSIVMEHIRKIYNEGYGYSDITPMEVYQYLITTYQNLSRKEEMYPILFQPEYKALVLSTPIFKVIADTILNSVSVYAKYYPILYDITSNPNLFYLVERLDTEGCYISIHQVDKSKEQVSGSSQ